MNNSGTATRGRVGFIDECRGIFVILMVIYHVMYNIVYIFRVTWPFFTSDFMSVVQRIIVGSFIVIAGVSSRYSKNNIKRGFIVLAPACIITIATVYFIPEQAIYFGVLHFLGSAMILYVLIRKLLDTLPSFWGLCLMILLTFLAWGIPSGYVGLIGLYVPLPSALYSYSFLFPIGLRVPGFFSADYVPIFPWIFAFFAGAYLGVFFEQGKMPAALYKTRFPFFALIGRRALMIYLSHQPIAFVILWIAFTGLSTG